MIFWTDDEIHVLLSYYGKVRLGELEQMLPGRSRYSISYQAKQYGLKANRSITNHRFTCNSSYFKMPEIVNSYWAGLIGADGCISGTNRTVTLYQNDIEVINKFKESVGYTGNTYHRIRSKGRIDIIQVVLNQTTAKRKIG
jgi:hypothetical protein